MWRTGWLYTPFRSQSPIRPHQQALRDLRSYIEEYPEGAPIDPADFATILRPATAPLARFDSKKGVSWVHSITREHAGVGGNAVAQPTKPDDLQSSGRQGAGAECAAFSLSTVLKMIS